MAMKSRNFFIFALLVLACQVKDSEEACAVQACTSMFEKAQKGQHISPSASYQFCTLIQAYQQCLTEINKGCRGYITYHSLFSSIQKMDLTYSCPKVIKNHHESGMEDDSYSPKNSQRKLSDECIYREMNSQFENRHCALFGDPHLRSFYNEFSTCTLEGAWPMVDNAYFSIQVTNSPVANGLKATAPTQVTVIIHGYNNCTQGKVYRADVSRPLPSTFTDGTSSRAAQSTRIHLVRDNPHAVVIMLRHAATRIVIRHVQKHLTIAIRAPREIAHLGESFSNELCNVGCPLKETIDHKKVIASPIENELNIKSRGLRTQSIDTIHTICRKELSGIYFEACLFDMLATGDTSFAEAARLANQDAKDMLKNQHLNRTSLRATAPFVYSSAASDIAYHLSQTIVLLGLLHLIRHLL